MYAQRGSHIEVPDVGARWITLVVMFVDVLALIKAGGIHVKPVLGSPALSINLVGPYSLTHMRHAQHGARVDKP